MQYLVRADEPFRGYVQSVLCENGTVAYTNGLTIEQYVADRGFPVRVIDDAEFDALISAFTDAQITEPREETHEQWDDALNVLPPCRWHTHRGVNLFHMSEALYGDIVTWHARIGDRYFAFNDRARATSEHLAAKVARAAQAAAQ